MSTVTLPDFDDMVDLANTIGATKTRLGLKKAEQEQILAEIAKLAMEDVEYWVNEKPPTNVYIKSTYQILGLPDHADYTKENLRTLRIEIAELEGDLKRDEILMNVYRDMIGVWRTQSANERGTFLEQ